MASINSNMAFVDGKWYRIADYPDTTDAELEETTFQKGIAYRYTVLTDTILLPYRGILDDEDMEDFDYNTAKPGIYLRRLKLTVFKRIIIRPRGADRENYDPSREQNVVLAMVNGDYSQDDFMDNDLRAQDIGKEIYLPPIYAADDPLNMLVKLAIRMKNAPFEPYGQRLKAMAVDTTSTSEKNNNVNNLKRRHRTSNTMSVYMAMTDTEIWELEPVFLVRNKPGAMHKLQGVPNDAILAVYPFGIPFEIDPSKIVDITDLVADAVAQTDSAPQRKRKAKPKRDAEEFDEDVDEEDEFE